MTSQLAGALRLGQEQVREIKMAPTSKWLALLATAVSIAACANFIHRPTPAQKTESERTSSTALAPDSPIAVCSRSSPATIDIYKVGVARHILRSNLGYTFDGHLPPMLPAVVVLRLSVDRTGKPTDVLVQRSRDNLATQIAVASIQRSGNFPLPCALIAANLGTVTFSETFLFNGQYQFQLRSLADPQ